MESCLQNPIRIQLVLLKFIWQMDNLAIYQYLTSYPDITENLFSRSQQLNVHTVISLVQQYKFKLVQSR